MLGGDVPLRGLAAIHSGIGVRQVGGRDTTFCSPADDLRENGLVAMGVPGEAPGAAHALSAGWLAVTDHTLAFVVPTWTGRPGSVFRAIPLDGVELRWRPQRTSGQDWHLYHRTYPHRGKTLHLVRMGSAADAQGFLESLGARARRMPG